MKVMEIIILNLCIEAGDVVLSDHLLYGQIVPLTLIKVVFVNIQLIKLILLVLNNYIKIDVRFVSRYFKNYGRRIDMI